MKKLLFGGLAGLLATASLVSAAPIYGPSTTLGSLVFGQSTLQVGDKLFGGFNYASNCNSCTPPDANSINVATINDNGVYGIRFSGPFSASGIGAFADFLIGFNVTVVNSSNLINGVSMSFNGQVNDASGYTMVTETIKNATGTTTLGQIFVNSPPPVLDASTTVTPSASIRVLKDIQLGNRTPGSVSTSLSTISFIDQMFTQTPGGSGDIPGGGPIPEPFSFVLMGSGLVAIAYTRRRRRAENN